MPNWFDKLLGINWRTTLAGISAIVALVGKVIVAYKAKDFGSVGTSMQELIPDLIVVLLAVGLIKAKDQNVTGTGTTAKSVDSSGQITNREGALVGQQSPPDRGKV